MKEFILSALGSLIAGIVIEIVKNLVHSKKNDEP